MKEILKNVKAELTAHLIYMIKECAKDNGITVKAQALYLFKVGYTPSLDAFDTEEEVLEFLEEHKLI